MTKILSIKFPLPWDAHKKYKITLSQLIREISVCVRPGGAPCIYIINVSRYIEHIGIRYKSYAFGRIPCTLFSNVFNINVNLNYA